MEQNKEISTCVQVEVLRKNVPLEFGAEISLPDYRSEISRLLWVRPTVLPPAHFVGGGNADFSGRVCYQVLYAGPDGALHVAELEDSYGFSLPVDGEMPSFSVCVVPDAVIGRVVAPRKLTVRCRANAQVQGYADACLGKEISSEFLDRSCVLTQRAESGRFVCATGEGVEIGEDFAANGISEILYVRAESFFSDISVGEGCVRCRGDVVATLLCRTEEDGTPLTLTRRLPCSFEMPVAGVDSFYRACVSTVVSEASAVVDEGRISLSLLLLPRVEAIKNEPITYIRDLFLPGKLVRCGTENKRLWQGVLCANRNFSISEGIPLSELHLLPDDVIIDAYAEAELKAGEGLGGEICCHVLYCRGKEFAVCEANIPFRIPLEDGTAGACTSSHVPILRMHVEGDKLRVDAELAVSVRAVKEAQIMALESVQELDEAVRGHLGVELCYPAPADTMWEIGKRYGVVPDRIAEANGVTGADVAQPLAELGVRCLRIPF